MKRDIILSGVGGQGILSIAAIIGEAALRKGLYVKPAEVHGMSQRGGRCAVEPATQFRADLFRPDSAGRYRCDHRDGTHGGAALSALSVSGGLDRYNSATFVNIPNYPDEAQLLDVLRRRPHVIWSMPTPWPKTTVCPVR